MFFFDNFIITQRTFYMISGFIILFIGTILNFTFSGLFNKKSQKISNIITIFTLIVSSGCFLPFLFGFLNPYSLKAIYFFDKNIAFGGLEIFLCFISQLIILAVFLISKKQLKKLRFKQYYFNSLYLCSALALNMLIVTKGFLSFVLSLEAISICTLFITLGFKNRNVFYDAYKYVLFSLMATIIMIFAYSASCEFEIDGGVLPVVSKILFIIALIIKSGFIFSFGNTQNNTSAQTYPGFLYKNTIILYTYAIALHKTVHEIFETGSFAQIFFVLFFIIYAIIGAFKITRAKNYEHFIYNLNSINFCILGFLFFIQNIQIHTAAIILLINIIIVNTGLLSAGAIFYINKNLKLDYQNFKGVCYSNPLYCNLLSIIIFISATLIPSGIFTSKFYMNNTLAQSGLWSSIVMFIFAIIYTLVVYSAIIFVAKFYNKPENPNFLEQFKKRTNTNYSILLASIFSSLILFVFNGYFASLITNFL